MKGKILIIPIIAMSFIFAPLSNIVTAQDEEDEEGKIVARIDFDPKTDGFRFKNYGRYHDGSNDLDAEDLILMFGADKVCIEGTTAKDCVLYETADRWMQEHIEAMRGGHCDGFSVASMRTWLDQPFKGKATPEQWQKDAGVTSDLEFDDYLSNYIAYYHSLQGLKEVNTFRAKSFKIPPTGIVKLLIESFQNGKEYYTLGVGMRVNGKYTRGHSILPFAVEDMGDGVFRIHVYDNNFPGETKYVTVDSKTETWRYRTASDPSKTASDYVGSVKTETLSLKKMSDRNRKKYECPFGEDTEGSEGNEGSANAVAEEIYFSFSGEGDLLITDPNGKQIGYDGKNKSEVNQISGAEIIYDDGGLDLNYSPLYVLPYNAAAKKPYQVLISGKDLKTEVNADLEIAGPGFVVGLEDLLLDTKEELVVSVSPDGQTLTFTASADGETPTIYVTTEDGPDKPSYSFEVGGVSIDAGKTLTMTVDIDKGKVFFKDNDSNEDAYDVHFERTNANGTKVKFDQDDLNMKGKDSFEVDLNKWDNTNKPCIKDDDDGDGFEDETCDEDGGGNKPPDDGEYNVQTIFQTGSSPAWFVSYFRSH